MLENRPKRWSYSALSTYRDCPRQYRYSYIERLDEREGAAASRGTLLHKEAEDYINGDGIHQFSKDLVKTGPHLMRMREIGYKAEEVWLVDRHWRPMVEEIDGITWAKAVVDLHHYDPQTRILDITDLKSGRRYPEHEIQLQLYALMGMKRYPEALRVDVSALYIDEGGVFGHRNSYLPSMFEHYARTWEEDAARMFADEEFLPTPSRAACRWCSFKASKGGPCQEGDIW